MKFQKSPYPYLLMLSIIIGLASFSKITVDKAVEEPIVYSIFKEKTVSNSEVTFLKENKVEEKRLNLAF